MDRKEQTRDTARDGVWWLEQPRPIRSVFVPSNSAAIQMAIRSSPEGLVLVPIEAHHYCIAMQARGYCRG